MYTPNQLVICDVDLVLLEIISRPYKEGSKLLVQARKPGTPTTVKAVDTATLVEARALCPFDQSRWLASAVGELLQCHVECPECNRKYVAKYDGQGDFLGFSRREVVQRTLRFVYGSSDPENE